MAPFRLSKTPRRALLAGRERKGRAASTPAVPPFLHSQRGHASLGECLRVRHSPGPTWAKALSSAGRSGARSTAFHRSRASTIPRSLGRTSCLLLPVNTGIDGTYPTERISTKTIALFMKYWRSRASPLTLRPPERRAGRTLHAVHCVHRDVLQKPRLEQIHSETGKQKRARNDQSAPTTITYTA